MKIHKKLEQRSPEWYKLRAGKLTCSALGNILTPAKLAISKSIVEYAYEKAAEIITGEIEPMTENWQMKRGVELEPEAVRCYEEHKGVTVERVGFIEGHYHIGYSPDGLVGDDGLIEIKCPSPKVHFKTLLDGKIDGKYMLQMQGGMLASGRQWCDFISYSEGLALAVIRVERDEVICDAIKKASEEFFNRVNEYVSHHNRMVMDGAFLTTKPEVIEL